MDYLTKSPFNLNVDDAFDSDVISNNISKLRTELAAANDDISKSTLWNIPKLLKRDVNVKNPAKFTEMLPLWVGKTALKVVTKQRIEEYSSFLSTQCGIKNFHDLVKHVENSSNIRANEAILSNLFIMEIVNYTASKIGCYKNNINVLEIGGGCGLLTEYMLKYSKYQYSVTLVDAIPESLAYSAAYLQYCLPTTKIITIEENEFKGNDNKKVRIIPSWKFNKFNNDQFDIILNISSMQEMPNETVNAYMKLIQKRLKNNGSFIFVNSRNYKWQREYSFPPQFMYIFKQHSPRSRTIDHPIDILLKTKKDITKQSLKIEKDYQNTLIHRQNKLINTLQKEQINNENKIKYLNKTLLEQKENAKINIHDIQNRQIKNIQKYKSRIEILNQNLKNDKLKSNEQLKKIKNRLEIDSQKFKSRIDSLTQVLKKRNE